MMVWCKYTHTRVLGPCHTHTLHTERCRTATMTRIRVASVVATAYVLTVIAMGAVHLVTLFDACPPSSERSVGACVVLLSNMTSTFSFIAAVLIWCMAREINRAAAEEEERINALGPEAATDDPEDAFWDLLEDGGGGAPAAPKEGPRPGFIIVARAQQ